MSEQPSEQSDAARAEQASEATQATQADSTATIDSGLPETTAPAQAAAGTQAEASGASTPESAHTGTSTNSTSADLAKVAEAGSPQSGSGATTTSVPEATPSPASARRSSTGATETSTSKRGSTTGSRHQADKDKDKPASKPSHTPTHASSKNRKRPKLGELDLTQAKIGFLGAGKMTESTINGLIHYAKIDPKRIHVAAPSSKGLEKFKALGCRVTKRNYDIFGRYDCDIIFLCFHGYVIKNCYKLGGNRPHPLTTNYIPHQRHPIYIMSLVSGVSLNQIKACLLNPESTNRYVLEIHRIMMNTAVGHGLGICAIDCEPDSKRLSAPIRNLMSSIAQLEHVPASQMDAACAIGGSGLAFSYYFINALADGAFKMGLSRQQAIRFASKTASCAAQTMLESGKHPAELRDNVSSPSGAAIYGIHVLEKNDVASGVTAAVEAAHKRANDLATQDVSN